MDREIGGPEAAAFVRRVDFSAPSGGSFEDAFKR